MVDVFFWFRLLYCGNQHSFPTSLQVQCKSLALPSYRYPSRYAILFAVTSRPNVLPQATVIITLMRKVFPSSLLRPLQHAPHPKTEVLRTTLRKLQNAPLIPCRSLAQVRSDREVLPEIWFTKSFPLLSTPEEDGLRNTDAPPDERTLKLGKSLFPSHRNATTV